MNPNVYLSKHEISVAIYAIENALKYLEENSIEYEVNDLYALLFKMENL